MHMVAKGQQFQILASYDNAGLLAWTMTHNRHTNVPYYYIIIHVHVYVHVIDM